MPLTDSDLAAIEERANKATPGPWWQEGKLPNPYVYGHVRGGRPNGEGIIQCTYFGSNTKDDGANAEFIAGARTDIPALLADLRAARQERDQAREALRAVEWSIPFHEPFSTSLGEPDDWRCPSCQGYKSEGHDDNCSLANALAATQETPCEDCPTTPVQHCCNWQVDTTKEEKADG